MNERHYLVVEPIPVIAQDLADCIAESDGQARVVCVPTLAQAVDAAARQGRVHAAFLHSDPDAFAPTALAARLAGDGTHLVFLGDAAEASLQRDRVLERPFSAETVGAMLAGLKATAGD